jgi:hypothetical protein
MGDDSVIGLPAVATRCNPACRSSIDDRPQLHHAPDKIGSPRQITSFRNGLVPSHAGVHPEFAIATLILEASTRVDVAHLKRGTRNAQ